MIINTPSQHFINSWVYMTVQLSSTLLQFLFVSSQILSLFYSVHYKQLLGGSLCPEEKLDLPKTTTSSNLPKHYT